MNIGLYGEEHTFVYDMDMDKMGNEPMLRAMKPKNNKKSEGEEYFLAKCFGVIRILCIFATPSVSPPMGGRWS